MKINKRVEAVFAYAVAMDNRGLRNTIHCVGKNVYIVNSDHSMILRFPLRQSEVIFSKPISFNANDYDSQTFEEVDGKIVFQTSTANYERKKICGIADTYSIQDLRKLYHNHLNAETSFQFSLSKDVCPLLDEDLSHTEISVEKGKLVLRQRNVYSGNIIEVTPLEKGLFTTQSLPESFGPVGLKTKDFLSLFTFYDSLDFFPAGDFLIVKEVRKRDFDGVLAFCKYDEIINLYKEDKKNGR